MTVCVTSSAMRRLYGWFDERAKVRDRTIQLSRQFIAILATARRVQNAPKARLFFLIRLLRTGPNVEPQFDGYKQRRYTTAYRLNGTVDFARPQHLRLKCLNIEIAHRRREPFPSHCVDVPEEFHVVVLLWPHGLARTSFVRWELCRRHEGMTNRLDGISCLERSPHQPPRDVVFGITSNLGSPGVEPYVRDPDSSQWKCDVADQLDDPPPPMLRRLSNSDHVGKSITTTWGSHA
jgi:hypothetical protein